MMYSAPGKNRTVQSATSSSGIAAERPGRGAAVNSDVERQKSSRQKGEQAAVRRGRYSKR